MFLPFTSNNKEKEISPLWSSHFLNIGELLSDSTLGYHFAKLEALKSAFLFDCCVVMSELLSTYLSSNEVFNPEPRVLYPAEGAIF